MTTISDATVLSAQVEQDALIYNAVAPASAFPAATFPLLGALSWSGLTFAEYAFTLGGNLAPFYPSDPISGTPTPGNPAAFVTQVFENALGRAPDAASLTFYEDLISTAPNEQGWAETIFYVGISPESHQHNAGLLIHI